MRMTARPKVKVSTARREWPCQPAVDIAGHRSRLWDNGPLPPEHDPRTGFGRIMPGEQYVQWQQWGETQRICVHCARAAGLLP